nr:putative ribonuclease H-like domain-containing protein [Tanacetum cinerariifolium]
MVRFGNDQLSLILLYGDLNDIVNVLLKLKFVKDHLCSSCELGKAKRKSFKTKTTPSLKGWLYLLHMDLCGLMRIESLNGKKYVLVNVDDYSRYTGAHFLGSKDETPKVLIHFLIMIQIGLHAQIRAVQTDRGTKFLNKSLHAYFSQEGIEHKTSIARTPEYKGVVERRNRTLVEAARTILCAAKLPLFFWAEAIATAYLTQLDIQTTPEPTTQTPFVTATENINQAKSAHVDEDEFINNFSTPVYEVGESSSRHVDPLNMHTFYQRHPSEYHWTKEHPLEQILGNPSQAVRTRRPLDTDGEMCMFALTMSQVKQKNIKDSMANHAWIEATQEELH